MNNSKDIDRLFREKFKDFETTVPKNAWENISPQIHYNSKSFNSKSNSYKTKYYVSACLIILGSALGLYVNSQLNESTQIDNFIYVPTQIEDVTNYEVVNIKQFQEKFKTDKDLLQQQVEHKNKTQHIRSIAVIEDVTPHKMVTPYITEKTVSYKEENYFKANIFKTDINSDVLRMKTTILTESEIENYINSVIDTTNTIINITEK